MNRRRIASPLLVSALALLAAGCTSSRFDSQATGRPVGPSVAASSGGPVVVYSEPGGAPSGGFGGPSGPSGGPYAGGPSGSYGAAPSDFSSEPLPPVGGGAVGAVPGSDPGFSAGGIIDETPDAGQPNTVIASRPPEEPRVRPAPSGRMGPVGTWRVREGTGASCRLSLSSAPALDLYKASASGCGNRDLGRITAWDNRDGEIYLYQPGGTVAARLRPGGPGYEGVLTKSGAALAMER